MEEKESKEVFGEKGYIIAMQTIGYEPTYVKEFSNDFLMWKETATGKTFGLDGWEMVDNFLVERGISASEIKKRLPENYVKVNNLGEIENIISEDIKNNRKSQDESCFFSSREILIKNLGNGLGIGLSMNMYVLKLHPDSNDYMGVIKKAGNINETEILSNFMFEDISDFNENFRAAYDESNKKIYGEYSNKYYLDGIGENLVGKEFKTIFYLPNDNDDSIPNEEKFTIRNYDPILKEVDLNFAEADICFVIDNLVSGKFKPVAKMDIEKFLKNPTTYDALQIYRRHYNLSRSGKQK